MTPWIVTDQVSGVHRCERCGATHRYTLPAPASRYVKEAAAFIRAHRSCASEPWELFPRRARAFGPKGKKRQN